MRTKNFLLTICVIIFVSLVFIIFGQEKPESIQNIVSTTNEQIRNFKDNLRDAETKTLNADEKYLNLLGFTDEPRLYPNDVWRNTSLPVVVTYVHEGQESQAIGLILNMAKILPNNTILVYNLGLDDQEFKLRDWKKNIFFDGCQKLKKGLKTETDCISETSTKRELINFCNSSRCQVINFDVTQYPPHVDMEILHAFRPLIIQDALRHTGAIFFLESNYRLSQNVVSRLFEERTLKTGILAWPFNLRNPVSSLTHKKMFEYFHTDADSFLFLQTVKAEALLIINSETIHKNVMLPWVQCALTQDCLVPIGAQSAGCKFDKKPQYRYSGCHSYDMSALNIVLGLLFKQDSSQYTCSDSANYFEVVPLSVADALLKKLELNSTTEGKLTDSMHE